MSLEEAIQDAKAMHKDNRPQYAIDIENMKNSTNLLDGSENFLAYLWDKFPGQFALYNEQVGLNNGLTPEWAKVYGDFSSGMLIENSAAVAINGARSYKCLKTSESILEGDVFAGSGMGSTSKGVSNPRNASGIVTGEENLSNPITSMRGSNGNIGVIPKEVADNLRGREFSNFDEFRKGFWEEYSNSSYASEFSSQNIKRMNQGLAPKATIW